MKDDDDLARADAIGYHRAIHGERSPVADASGGDDDVGHTVLGNMTIHPQAQPPPRGMHPLLKAALVAAGLGTAGLIGWELLKMIPKPTAEPGKTVIKTLPGKDTDFRVKTPIIRE